MERKIGEVFNYNNISYVVVKTEEDNCMGCDFNTSRCTAPVSYTGRCSSAVRADKNPVIFKIQKEVKERAIGSTFEYNNETYKVVVGNSCDDCCFNSSSCSDIRYIRGRCNAHGRSDSTSVYFVKQNKIKETMKQEKIEINIPNGYKAIQTSNDDGSINITFKKCNKLPSTWEKAMTNGLIRDQKYAVNFITGNVIDASYSISKNSYPIYFKTIEQAKAWQSLYKLIHLRDLYNDGWVFDRTNEETIYYIYCNRGGINTNWSKECSRILYFKSSKLRDLFLKNFKDLIEDVKEFL